MQEADRLRQENEQWRELAMRNAPPPQQQYQNFQPANERAFSSQEPSLPSYSVALENPDEYNRQLQAYISHTNQNSIQQAAAPILGQLAEAGRYMSQNDSEYRDVWGKYSAEIEQEMVRNNVPPHMRTKQSWDLVAGIVRGRHYRELADEIATQRLQSGGFGTEGSSNVGTTTQSNPDGLAAFWASDHSWVVKAKNNGMSTADVRKYIAAQGITEEKWVEDMTKGRSFSAEAA